MISRLTVAIVGAGFALSSAPAFARTTLGSQQEEIEVAFAPRPKDQALRLVEKAIDSSTQSLEIAAYEMTSKRIANAMLRAVSRGVAVYAVLDANVNAHDDDKSQRNYLIAGGAHVRVDANYPVFHHKFIVVDCDTLETGSLNFTWSAQRRNAENVIVIWHNPYIAGIYATQFRALRSERAD